MSETKILTQYVTDLDHIKDQVGMSDWEREFVESMKERNTLKYLSPKQKTLILDLAQRYGV